MDTTGQVKDFYAPRPTPPLALLGVSPQMTGVSEEARRTLLILDEEPPFIISVNHKADLSTLPRAQILLPRV